MWGIIPAAGRGTRIQPLGFSKELLPLGTRANDRERPCAVSEYLVERMITAGADKLCFVIAPGKSDILEYFGQYAQANTAYVVQPSACGLCDAIFRAAPLVGENETVIVGLPGSTQQITGQLSQTTQVQPTLRVRQGTSVSVFVARDLDFSTVDD